MKLTNSDQKDIETIYEGMLDKMVDKFTGEITYTNLPPLINWKDELVSTINSSSYTSNQTGLVNTVIAPIREMSGDTLKIIVSFLFNAEVSCNSIFN